MEFQVKLDTVTFWLFMGIWPFLLFWELFVLFLRSKGLDVDTVSMVARDNALRMNSMVFVWCGLASHFWLNWGGRTYSSAIPAITFWVLVAGTLVLDIVLWNKPYDSLPKMLQIYRHPAFQMIWGIVAGLVLFPQQIPFKLR